MIAYFVCNMNSLSGASTQAKNLSLYIAKPIIFFNHERTFKNKFKNDNKHLQVEISPNFIFSIFQIFYYTLKYKVTVFHLHGHFISGLLVGYILRKKIVLKTTLLGDDDFKTASCSKFWIIKKFFIKHISYNIVLSEPMKNINMEYFPREKIKLIPNGVKLPDSCISIAQKSNHFCCVGLVCPRKRTLEAITYYHRCFSNLENSSLHVIGPYMKNTNYAEYSELYAKKCYSYVMENGLSSKVIFHELLSQTNTFQYFINCKAIIHFSEKEGMPNVVLEAMAHNCVPIISEMDGVFQNFILSGKNGYVITNFSDNIDIQGIDKKIIEFSPYLSVKNNFEFPKIAKLYNDIYELL